jgi:hypothetical protein
MAASMTMGLQYTFREGHMIAGIECPGDLQILYVFAVDLGEAGIVNVVGPALISRPSTMVLRGNRG